MSYIPEFITVAGIGLLGAISPGPDFLIVTRNALRYGRRAGIGTALGVGTGILVHISYSLIGIGLIIASSIVLFNTIKLLGAGYLIYLGLRAIFSKKNQIEISEKHSSADITFSKAFSTGFLTNLLNPKAAVFFVGLFSQVIDPNTPAIIQFLLGSQVAIIGFVWFTLLSIMLSHRLIRTKTTKAMKQLERVFGALLVAVGIKVAITSR